MGLTYVAVLVFVITVVPLFNADMVCIDTSVLIQRGSYLENFLFGVTSASSIFDCASDCSVHPDCQSFGFEPKSPSCHLHTGTSTSATGGLKERFNWLHSDINPWPKSISGPCSRHRCITGERCSPQRTTKEAICVKAHTELPPGYCPLPPVIPRASVSSGPQREGHMRIYTCNHGYRDVGLDAVNLNTTCTADGTWSPTFLNCSGPYIRLETPNAPTYSFLTIPPKILSLILGSSSTLTFLVKTCNDANFVLYYKCKGKWTFYEIVIGGSSNKASSIRKTGKQPRELIKHTEANILSCREYRPFWLTWENKTIAVGKGIVVGKDMFLKWTFPSPLNIKHIGISTYIANAGTWLFLHKK